MKKIIIFILTAIMFVPTIGLIACSKPSGGVEGELYIRYFTGGFGETWMEKVSSDFAAEKGCTVKLEPSSSLTVEAQSILESGRGIPDLMLIQYTNYRKFVQEGWLENIDDLYTEKIYEGQSLSEVLEPDFATFGKARKNMNEPEHFYMVPWTSPTTGLAYNVKMLADVGYNEPPKTVSELKDLCNKLNTAGITPFAWGGAEPGYWNNIIMTWWAQYESVLSWQDFWKFTNPEVYKQQGRVKALEVLQELIVDSATGNWKNSISKPMGRDHMDAFRNFVQGKAAMTPAGAWIENEISDFIEKDFEMKMMLIPAIDGAKETNIINTEAGDMIFIPALATSKDLAKDFIRYMNKIENLQLFTKYTGVPRPFTNYKVSELTDVSEFKKNLFTKYDASKKLFRNSDSPFYSYLGLDEWYGKGVATIIGEISGANKKTAFTINEEIYNDVKANWKRWEHTLGL